MCLYFGLGQRVRKRDRCGKLKEVVSGFPPFFLFVLVQWVTQWFAVESVQLCHRFTVLITGTESEDSSDQTQLFLPMLPTHKNTHTGRERHYVINLIGNVVVNHMTSSGRKCQSTDRWRKQKVAGATLNRQSRHWILSLYERYVHCNEWTWVYIS